MTTLQLSLTSPTTAIRTQKNRQLKQESATATEVPAERVQEMLREIAFVLHATRVIGRKDRLIKASKG